MSSPAGKGNGAKRPYFFLSYAHVPRNPRSTADPNRFVKKLYHDLCDAIPNYTAEEGGQPIGFLDKSMHTGQRWADRLSWELAHCRVFVPLYSPRYFKSVACGREWHAFTQRPVYHREPGSPEGLTGIVPALWSPMEYYKLPQVASDLQFNHDSFGAQYTSEGLFALMKITDYSAHYNRAVLQLARRIVEMASRTIIPTIDPLEFESLPSAFGPPPAGDRVQISVFSLSQAELPTNRSTAYYGPRRTDWQPYHPASTRPLAEDAMDVARNMGFEATVTEFEDEADTLLTCAQPDAPNVLLVDRWALMDNRRAEKVRQLDHRNPAWLSVLEPWNQDDEECRQHARVLDGLSESYISYTRGTPKPSLRDAVSGDGPTYTLGAFRRELERAVIRASAGLEQRASKPPTGPPKPRLR